MLNKKEVKTRTSLTSMKKYISLAVVLAAFAVLAYVVPTIGDNVLCILAGTCCIGTMIAAVRFGGLSDEQ